MRHGRFCLVLAVALAAAAAVVASGTCPYSDANTRCAAAGGRLPDVNAALAGDKRVPAIMMYGSGGASADLLKITPFTDIIKMLDKYGDRSLSECSPSIFKGKQMAEDLTFDNTFAACPLAPLNKSAAYVAGGLPRLTDIYPEWLAAFPKVKAFVQSMKQYGMLAMVCVGLQPCNNQLTLTYGITPLVATPRFQIGPLSAWTHLTGFAYSSGGTFTPPEWATTAPPPFWVSDPLNPRDIGTAKRLSTQGNVYVQGPHSAGTLLSGNITLPGVAVKMGYQTNGFTLLNQYGFVMVRSENGFEATLWNKLNLQLRWLKSPVIAAKGTELWLTAAGQQVTLDLSKRSWPSAYLPINRFLIFSETYGSQWLSGAQLYVGPTGASLRLNVGNTPPIPPFSTTLTDLAAQLLGRPKIVGNFSMIFKARKGSDWMQFAVEVGGKVTPMPFCRTDADCYGTSKCGGTMPPICVQCLTDGDCPAGSFCQVSASLPFARRFVCAKKASACPYQAAPTACVTPTYALPDVGAALAADARVPALTMTGFDGKTTGDLLKMLPFADVVGWLNGNGNRSLHDCSLPVLTGSMLLAQTSNPIYSACPIAPLAATASYVVGAIPSLPDIPREQVAASPAMSQMKTAMGQFGPRLALCLGLQPCSGAPALVMGLTNLTARVKAKLGAFSLETKLESFAYSPGGGFIPPAWRGSDPAPFWSCDPTAPTAGTTQALSKQGPVFLGGGPGGEVAIPGVAVATMESQPTGWALLNSQGFALVQADHGPVISLWGGRLTLTMRGFPQPVLATKGGELWLHAEGPIDPQLVQRLEPSINFALGRVASLAQRAASLDVHIGPKGAAVRVAYSGGATPTPEAAEALGIPATAGPLTAVFTAAVGAFRFESAFLANGQLVPLSFCRNSADCPADQVCGADSGRPRQPFCRACFDDSACGAGQRCSVAPSPQPLLRGLPRAPAPWTCYASGTFTPLAACSRGARRGGFYLPRDWQAWQPLPMAVVLHPFASSGQEFVDAFFSGWADANKFLVVAPTSAGDSWDWRNDPAAVMSCVNAAKSAAGASVDASAVLATGFQGGATFAPYLCTSYRAFTACALMHGKLGNTALYGPYRPNAWVSTARDDASNTPADAAALAWEFRDMGMASVTLRNNYEGRATYVHQELQGMLSWWLSGAGSQ